MSFLNGLVLCNIVHRDTEQKPYRQYILYICLLSTLARLLYAARMKLRVSELDMDFFAK